MVKPQINLNGQKPRSGSGNRTVLGTIKLLCAKGNGMPKEVLKKRNLLAYAVAGVFSALLAFITMALLGLGLSDSTEDTMPSLVQALLFGCLFSVFNLFTLRLSKWLYS